MLKGIFSYHKVLDENKHYKKKYAKLNQAYLVNCAENHKGKRSWMKMVKFLTTLTQTKILLALQKILIEK